MTTATATRRKRPEPKTEPAPLPSVGAVVLERKGLLAALRVASRIMPRRATLPCLAYALLKHVNGRVSLRAGSLEVQYEVTLKQAEPLAADWEVLLPVRAWLPVLAALDVGTVRLSWADGVLHLESDTAKFTEPQLRADYVLPMDFEAGERYVVDGQSLRTALNRVTFAVAGDDSRPILTSVYVGEFDGRKSLMAADGFRLSIAALPGEGELPDVMIPAEGARLLARVAGDDLVGLGVNPQRTKLAAAIGAGVTVTMHLVQGTFPNISGLVRTECEHSVTVPAPALLRASKLLAPVALEGSGIVRFRASSDGLVASSTDHDGRNAEVRLLCPVEGEDGRIALNYRFFADAMRAIGGGEVRWEWEAPSKQMVFRNVADPGHLQVVMPMFVQWEDA